MFHQVRQCIYVGFYRSECNKMKIGETSQKAYLRAKDIAKDDFKLLWFGELAYPKKGYGQLAENYLREFFKSFSETMQISPDHFYIKKQQAPEFIQAHILDMKLFLRENNIKVTYEKFLY